MNNDLDVRLRRYLCIFSIVSGLQINLHKSFVVCVRIDQGEVHHSVSSLGFLIGSLPIKYLGFTTRRMEEGHPEL